MLSFIELISKKHSIILSENYKTLMRESEIKTNITWIAVLQCKSFNYQIGPVDHSEQYFLFHLYPHQ